MNWEEKSRFVYKQAEKKYPHLPQKFKEEHLENYFVYLHFPYKIQRMIYTTNWVERLIKEVRKTQKHRNAFPNPESALNLIGAFLMNFEGNTYQYSLPIFIPVQDRLDEILEEMNPYQTQFTCQYLFFYNLICLMEIV